MEEEEDVFGADYFVDPEKFSADADAGGEGPMSIDEFMDEKERDEAKPAAGPNSEEGKHSTSSATTEAIAKGSPEKVVLPNLLPDVVPLEQLPEDGDVRNFFPVSAGASSRVYLMERRRFERTVEGDESINYLEKPFSVIQAEAVVIAQKREIESTHWQNQIDSRVSPVDSSSVDTRQFVDKYRPTRFVDLLTDDTVNMQVLGWLSKWRVGGMKGGSNVPPDTPKILLIGGAPGVGKSILIDVCCRHYQFQVIESNASQPDRGSKTAMAKTIVDVCGNRSVLDAHRPQVLVIEEVDGDECTAAEVLVDMLNKTPEIFKRPVVCICSDVYTKSLRLLRERSLVITLGPPKLLKLAQKVKQICQLEKIKIESLAIDKLIQICDCDIRSVLNQLQSLAARRGGGKGTQNQSNAWTVAEVIKYVGGQEGAIKDNLKSELDLMEMIFEPKRSRGRDYQPKLLAAISNAKSANIDVFAHCMLTVPFTDHSFRHQLRVSELVAKSDMDSTTTQLFFRYASLFCAAVGRPRIDIGGARKIVSARFTAQTDRIGTLQALAAGSAHSVRAARMLMSHLFGPAVALLLLWILNPEHNQVWTKKSHTNVCHPEIARVAKVYADFGIELAEPIRVTGASNGWQVQQSNPPQSTTQSVTNNHNSHSNHNNKYESKSSNFSKSGGYKSKTEFLIPVAAPILTPTEYYGLQPNLRLLCVGEDQVPKYAVGSPMGETLKNQIKVELARLRSLHDSTVELISRGVKRKSLAPTVVEDQETNGSKKSNKSLAEMCMKKGDNDKSTFNSDGTKIVVSAKVFPFEYRFNEGHTNAVRRVMRLNDFLPPKISMN